MRAADRAKDKGDLAEVGRLTEERRSILKMSVSVLGRAIEVNPDYISAHRNAYINYLRLEDRARALYHLEQVLRCAGARAAGQAGALPGVPGAGGGDVRAARRAIERAARHYEEILRRRPDFPRVREKLAATRRRMEEARIE